MNFYSSSTRLAPGFRFHPTDDELVTYYLKRRLLRRRIADEPISDIDLYKFEPWDLPSMSRLQTRDMEWYFFSPLDRKYVTRSRTNRTAVGGYWKTTGKDRQVRHGNRAVGMKKTLVFHSGRAPRGERTNWVMHEYRLDDEELRLAGVAQDAFVVCKIFQKNGPGPQNGAQYGASFVEEEWEEDEMENQAYLQMDDFMQDPEASIQHENTDLFVGLPDAQASGNHLVEPTLLLENLFKDQTFATGSDEHINGLAVPNNPGIPAGIVESTLNLEQSYIPPYQSDSYVELNDLLETVNVDHSINEDSADYVNGTLDDQNTLIGVDEYDLLEIDVEKFFDILNENVDTLEPFQMPSDLQGDVEQLPNDCVNSTSSVSDAQNNSVCCDGVNYDVLYTYDSFAHMDGMCSAVADSCRFDKFDELMEYFDATDSDLQCADLDLLWKLKSVDSSSCSKSNFALEFNGISIPTHEASLQASEAEISASFLAVLPEHISSGKKEEPTVEQYVQKNEGSDKTLTGRLVSMLGSMPSPPAFAAEHPAVGIKSMVKKSTTLPASSTRTAARIIDSSNLTVFHTANHLCLQKNGDHRSYAVGSNVAASKQVSFEPFMRIHCRFMSMVLRGGVYVLFFSTLILAASCKIGLDILTR